MNASPPINVAASDDDALLRADTKLRRHKWGAKVVVSAHKSERECEHGCGIVKATRHENNSHWVEYWRGLEKIDVIRTPACEPVDQGAAS